MSVLNKSALNKILAVALLVGAAPTTWAESPPAAPAANAAFASLADDFFDNYYFPNNPTAATSAGIHNFDAQLEDYSRTQVDREIAALHAFDKRFAAVDPKSLDEMTRGDLDLVLNYIHGTLLTLETIRPWEKNADIYSSGITNSAFTIMERKFAPPADRLRVLIAREKQMPAAFAAARANLKNPPKIYTEIALEQLPGLVALLRKGRTGSIQGCRRRVPQEGIRGEQRGRDRRAQRLRRLAQDKTCCRNRTATSSSALTPTRRSSVTTRWSTFRSTQLVDIDMANLRRNQARVRAGREGTRSDEDAAAGACGPAPRIIRTRRSCSTRSATRSTA